MSSLISVVCSVSHDLPSVSSFYTLSTLSHGPGSSQWGGQRLPQGENAGPKAEVHVGFRINWNDFCFPKNIVQTVFVLYLNPKKIFKLKAFG